MNKVIIGRMNINQILKRFEDWYIEYYGIHRSFYHDNHKYGFKMNRRYPVKRGPRTKEELSPYPYLPFYGISSFLSLLKLYIHRDERTRECLADLSSMVSADLKKELLEYLYESWEDYFDYHFQEEYDSFLEERVDGTYYGDKKLLEKGKNLTQELLKETEERLERIFGRYPWREMAIGFDDSQEEIEIYSYGYIFRMYYVYSKRYHLESEEEEEYAVLDIHV